MKSRLLGLGLAVQIAILPTYSKADQCLRTPAEIPGLTGEPEWDNFDGTNFWRPELHDPRWAGSSPRLVAVSPGASSPLDDSPISVRVVALGNTVSVALYVEDDTDGPTQADEVYVGISEGTSNTAHALRIRLNCGAFSEAEEPPIASAPRDVDKPRLLNAAVSTHWKSFNIDQPTPTWEEQLSDDKLAGIKGACWDRVTAQSPRWAVTLRFEFDGTANKKRRLFFGVKTANEAAGTATVLGNVAPVDPTAGVKGQSIIPVSPSNWEVYSGYVSPTSACGKALSVASDNIGIWPGTAGSGSGSLTQEVCTSSSCGDGTNVFRAYITGATRKYHAWEVLARFRISDWGSVNLRSALWKSIWVDSSGTKDPFSTVPTASDPWFFQHADAKSAIAIDYECERVGTDAYCPKLGPGRPEDQQLLVEIARKKGQAVLDAYALRSMKFKGLSAAADDAIISVDGLEKSLPDIETFEIYVQEVARNMPAPSQVPRWLETDAMNLAHEVTRGAYRIKRQLPIESDGEQQAPGIKKAIKKSYDKDFLQELKLVQLENELAEQDVKRITTLASNDAELVPGVKVHEVLAMTESQLFDAIWPTYRIRPYYLDTKSFKNEKGEPQPLLVPMPAFGWRLQHRGSLYGFTQSFETNPAGAKDGRLAIPLEPVANLPGWRKLPIPVTKTAVFSLKAAALEQPPVVTQPGTTTGTSTGSAPTTTTDRSTSSVDTGNSGCHPCAIHAGRSNYRYGVIVLMAALALGYRRVRRKR